MLRSKNDKQQKEELMSINRWVAVVAVAVVLATGLGVRSVAQEGGSGLQISPTRREISILPGEIKTVTFQIKNVTTAATTVSVNLNDFEPEGDSGNPKIIVDSEERLPSSLEPFLDPIDDISLNAGETKEVNIELEAPRDIPAGAYYGAIRFTAQPKESQEDRQLTLNASVAPLILVEVSGDITEQIQINSIKAFRGDKSGSFFLNVPEQLGIEIKNTGTGFSRPFGRIAINDIRGKEVYSYEVNNKDPRGNVLPNSTRVFKDELKNVNRPGRYTAVANVSHGTGGQLITVQSSFWYIPAWLLATIVVVLLGLAAGGYAFYKTKFGGPIRPKKSRK